MKTKVKISGTIMLGMVLGVSILFPMEQVTAASAAEIDPNEIYYMNENEIVPYAFTNDNETIYYDSKSVTSNETGPTFPCFENSNSNIHNYCAPLAGTVLLGYYDRWFESLIPGYSTWVSFGPVSIYSGLSSNDYIQSAFERLYDLTKTNVGHAGTTQAAFVDGLNEYVAENDLQIDYHSVMQGDTINLSVMDTYLDNEVPVLLLCETYNIVTLIKDEGDRIELSKINSDIAHMMVAYGYEQYSYYRNGVKFRTDTYLKVASGVNGGELCYAKLDDDMELVEAWAIEIYE